VVPNWCQDGHALVLDDLADVLVGSLPTWSWELAPTAACGPTPAQSGNARSAT
jgi:hypothetical protein